MCTGGKPGRSTAALASNACRTSATSRPYRATLSEAQTNGTTHTYMRAHTHTHNWIDTDTWQHTSPRPRSTTPSSLILAINDHKARVYLQTNIKPQQKMCIGEANPRGRGLVLCGACPYQGDRLWVQCQPTQANSAIALPTPKPDSPRRDQKCPTPIITCPWHPPPPRGRCELP